MSTPFEIMFSFTLSRDGRVTVSGRPVRGSLPQVLPGVLRMIADSVEDGSTLLQEDDEP